MEIADFFDDHEDYFRYLQNKLGCKCNKDSFKCSFSNPKYFGKGTFKLIRPREGMEIWKTNQVCPEDIKYNFSLTKPHIELTFCLSGWVKVINSESGEIKIIKNGECSVSAMQFSGEITYRGGVPQEFVAIKFYKSFFNSQNYPLLNLDNISIEDKNLFSSIEYNSRVKELVESIYNTDFDNLLQPLSVEAKALELLSIVIEDKFMDDVEVTKNIIDQESLDKLNRVRLIIDSKPEEKVNIPDLSRMAGLNSFKLTKEFKSNFGCTINEYRTKARIKKAEILLKSGYPVTEVSYATGYMDISHFTKVFKRELGVTPSIYSRSGNL